MKIGFVIPARLKSTRLPKKIIMKIGEQTALEWAIDRARAAKSIDEVVVATTGLQSDSQISKICADKGVRYFMGDPDDVLKRLRDTADYFDFDYIVNITPDNVLFSIYLIELMVDAIKENPAGEYFRFTDAMFGTGIYALKKQALDVVCEFKDIIDTEIWGPLFHEEFYKIVDLKVPAHLNRSYRLTMDTEADYALVSRIYRDLGICRSNLTDLNVIVDYLDKNPDIASINQNIVQAKLDPKITETIDSLYHAQTELFNDIKRRVYGRSK